MDELWIKEFITSPLQSTSFSSVLSTPSSSSQFETINLLNFTPLNVPLPLSATNSQQMRRTPLSRRVVLCNENSRKRPAALLENDTEITPKISLKIQSPKTPRLAVKILKKVAYEDSPSAYLVQWNYGTSKGEENPSTSWEWANKLSSDCRKLVERFEQSIAKDPRKAWEFTDYEVEALLDRTVQGQLRYLVKWVGWRVPTWEKVKYLLPEYGELVETFEQQNLKHIQFWSDSKRNILVTNEKDQRDDSEEPDEIKSHVSLFNYQKCQPPMASAAATSVVKAIKVLNKLDRNKEAASYLMLWPEEAGVRSNENANTNWEKRISLGTVEAIAAFEEAVKKRKGWARQSIMYEVEKVLGRRKHLGAEAPHYLVKWKGYEDKSWETMESLQICYKHLLVAYALERPRTLKEGRLEASAIRRKDVTEDTKESIRRINERVWKTF